MDSKDRAALIRKGNELFNAGHVVKAIEIFEKTGYKDGLMRAADYYYFDRKMPLVAVKYYRLAGAKERVDEIYARMIMALGQWLGKGVEKQAPRVELPPLKVSPKLKILAEEILSRSAGNKQGS